MNSQDSRYWRLLPEEYIVGKTWIIRKTMKLLLKLMVVLPIVIGKKSVMI